MADFLDVETEAQFDEKLEAVAQQEPTIVRLHSSAIPEVKSLLYHAYRHEPTFKYLFEASRPGYEQRVRATLREGLKLHFEHQQDAIGLLDHDVLAAVALIGAPEHRFNLADQLSWRLRMMMTAGISTTKRYLDYHGQIRRCFPDDLYHHLPFIGVHPKYQSRGYGRLLMETIEGFCAESPRSSGIGLDTGNARYLRFYESLGYERIGEVRFDNITETVLFKRVV
ncbi:GNAT family N-acetyltransferase [Allohahella sp. A8]|uniref:GNAT family N-acetyltransferase n=1 Tax=Allohahella sp. A8 TaxID=3141461 RepID=UPI000C0B2A84|nr:GNAT family N-acetyltransferase [Hahellaceae bacterium]|tara:strand:+ start:47341 stop:48015 length:675 start_codon:yes stop_codon:yes gene_type:complete